MTSGSASPAAVRPRRRLRSLVPYIRRVEQSLPGRLSYLAWRARCAWVDVRDRAIIRREGWSAIPPAWLRSMVGASADLEHYLRVGQACRRDLEACLERSGASLRSQKDVLDFGCGCGRTLRWLEAYSPPVRFVGSDLHPPAIAWCRDHLPFARFSVNRTVPPLPFPGSSFDLVYAISVFTHMVESMQAPWAAELCRVVRPGGIVVITVHGEAWRASLPRARAARVVQSESGFGSLRDNTWKGLFPAWYQSSFHSRTFTTQTLSAGMVEEDYVDRGMGGVQDVVILRRPSSPMSTG